MGITVTGFTSARMLAIENNSVVDGEVVVDDLILTRHDGGVINAGNVRGQQGPIGSIQEVGTFIFGGWATTPVGYLILDGTTITNGALIYDDLAACFPGWVSNDNLILPNGAGSVIMGAALAGVISGSMLHSVTTANMPLHTHTGPNHAHTGPSHSHTGPSHSHTGPSHQHTGPSHRHMATHNHPAVTSGSDSHEHDYLRSQTTYLDRNDPGTGGPLSLAGANGTYGTSLESHNHTVDLPSISANTDYNGTGNTAFWNSKNW
jgi:hypothetical protein